jgi:hypothetical protein
VTCGVPALYKELNTANGGPLEPIDTPNQPYGRPSVIWNKAAITTLCTQLADDYYHMLVGRCDLVYSGIYRFKPEWACDGIVDLAADDYPQTVTRVVRQPGNRHPMVDLLPGLPLEVYRQPPQQDVDLAAPLGGVQLIGGII